MATPRDWLLSNRLWQNWFLLVWTLKAKTGVELALIFLHFSGRRNCESEMRKERTPEVWDVQENVLTICCHNSANDLGHNYTWRPKVWQIQRLWETWDISTTIRRCHGDSPSAVAKTDLLGAIHVQLTHAQVSTVVGLCFKYTIQYFLGNNHIILFIK